MRPSHLRPVPRRSFRDRRNDLRGGRRIGLPPGGIGPTDAYLARSSDLGDTWQFSTIARSQEVEFTSRGGTKAKDQERYEYIRMAVHPTDPKRLYAGFRYRAAQLPAFGVPPDDIVPSRSLVSVSSDEGRTWSKPVN
ncbi:MAG TPA: hypothetical protein VET24_10430, partial [Actinomycetota bacterium]|nr:hypothetical protein [Actinomycetota bacterium]